jgi:hypothetical protein
MPDQEKNPILVQDGKPVPFEPFYFNFFVDAMKKNFKDC